MGGKHLALATLAPMVGVIFHWWLGLLLALVGGLAVVSLIAGYLKQVVSPQFPSKRQRRDD
ncbi:MAG: hypothetical protein RI900_1308 [Actinomycetota bacterium]|jgi:hypothetical protein